MGGDYGPSVAVPAALKCLALHPELSLVLVGDQGKINPYLSGHADSTRTRLEVFHTEVSIDNATKPETVLRKYKNSSMYIAVELVKEKRVDACVSAGNTGALLMIGRHLLKTIPGISKPAIIASIPASSTSRRRYILDVGANVNCEARQLLEFAVMGSVLASSLNNTEAPRVGLLNIGHEEHKGTEQIRVAAQLLEKSAALNYIGFVEGNEIFDDKVDVVVCDGFAGNVTIKTSAGVVRKIESLLEESATRTWLTRLYYLIASPLLRSLKFQINPAKFNGASLLGLQGIIVKSHGNARIEGFYYAIEQAIKEISDGVPDLISHKMSAFLDEADSIDSLTG